MGDPPGRGEHDQLGGHHRPGGEREDSPYANVQNPDIQSEAVNSGKVEDQTLTKADLVTQLGGGLFEIHGTAFPN